MIAGPAQEKPRVVHGGMGDTWYVRIGSHWTPCVSWQCAIDVALAHCAALADEDDDAP